MTPATLTDLALLDTLRQTEQRLARMELAVAAHYGFAPPYAPPYPVLMQWLSGKSGAECEAYWAQAEAHEEGALS